MKKQITAGQVHKALVDSIELRWKKIRDDEHFLSVSDCQLCKLFNRAFDSAREGREACDDCPLSLIGQRCNSSRDDAWTRFLGHEFRSKSRKAAAQNMIDQLHKCLDTFFPAGLSEED